MRKALSNVIGDAQIKLAINIQSCQNMYGESCWHCLTHQYLNDRVGYLQLAIRQHKN